MCALRFPPLLSVVHYSHRAQDDFQNGVVSHGGIDHHFVLSHIRPLFAEIAFYKRRTLMVDAQQQIFSLAMALAERADAADLLVPGRIDEDAQRVRAITEEIGRASADYDAITARAASSITPLSIWTMLSQSKFSISSTGRLRSKLPRRNVLANR